jgi:hypothetical protein
VRTSYRSCSGQRFFEEKQSALTRLWSPLPPGIGLDLLVAGTKQRKDCWQGSQVLGRELAHDVNFRMQRNFGVFSAER